MKRLLLFGVLAVIFVSALAACGEDAAAPAAQIVEVTKEIIVEKEVIKEVPVEVIVEKEVVREVVTKVPVTVMVTATPPPLCAQVSQSNRLWFSALRYYTINYRVTNVCHRTIRFGQKADAMHFT